MKKDNPFGLSFLVRTTGLVVSEASVIAERANLFAEVKRQLYSVQEHTECADNALHCHKSCCKPRYEKTNRIVSVRFILVWCGQQDLNLHSLATIRT